MFSARGDRPLFIPIVVVVTVVMLVPPFVLAVVVTVAVVIIVIAVLVPALVFAVVVLRASRGSRREGEYERSKSQQHYGHVEVIGSVPQLKQIHRRALLQVFHSNFDAKAFRG